MLKPQERQLPGNQIDSKKFYNHSISGMVEKIKIKGEFTNEKNAVW